MSVSRRLFVRTLGLGGVAALAMPAVTARGREALLGTAEGSPLFLVPSAPIRLDSNENPNGPGAAALDAIRGAMGEASRYPDRPEEMLRESVARSLGTAMENVLLGCGSTEILRMAVHEWATSSRPLVTAAPTFEAPAHFAQRISAAVVSVPVDAALRLDLAAMAGKAAGAGLVYLCNPNNPTATARTLEEVKDFVSVVTKSSPGTTILIDEAYYEYADQPGYATAIPLALENQRVIVSRTFSKVFGLAGLRAGYVVGGAATIEALSKHGLPSNVNVLAAAAAMATLDKKDHIEEQRRLNRESKQFTRQFFESAGYKVVPSEANFMMVDIRRDAREFSAACRKRNVMIGRAFPPLTTYTRISMGTMDEMRQAAEVFRQVLASGS